MVERRIGHDRSVCDEAMKSHEPRSNSSCAACKFLKRRCTPNCTFAPYFRSDEPKKFARVHKVFGASNVSKILIEVAEEQREDAVNSLAYEAEARLKDPVYGCIGAIAMLHKRMVELQHDLAIARARLAHCAAYKNSTLVPCDPVNDAPFTELPVVGMDQVLYLNQNSLEFSHHGLMNELSQDQFLF